MREAPGSKSFERRPGATLCRSFDIGVMWGNDPGLSKRTFVSVPGASAFLGDKAHREGTRVALEPAIGREPMTC